MIPKPKRKKSQEPNYDVSSGTKEFDSFNFESNDSMVIQAFYSNFTQNDCKLQLLDSLDGVNFVVVKDAAGNDVEITMPSSDASVMLRVLNFVSPYYKLKYVEGTANAGTLSKILIQEG